MPSSFRRSPSRRDFLKAIAAGAALTPLLDSRLARGQAAAPKRVVLVYNPNGTVPDAFWPTQAPGAAETDFTLAPILEPLEPFKSRLLLMRGLDLTVTDRQFGPGGPHQRGMGALFTGRELQQGTMADGDGSLAGWANGVSVDQELVRRLDPPTLLPSLELGVRATASDVRSRMIYTAPGIAAPPENDPRDVFERLSTGFQGGGAGAANPAQREQRRLVLQAVQDQFRLLSPRVSPEDRDKLARHGDLLNGITRRLDYSLRPSPACVQPVEPPVLPFDTEGVMPEVTKLQLDLLVLAFACDATRIASVQFSSAINAIRFPWVNSLDEGHALSHRGPSDADARAQMIARGRWYSEQVAYLMGALSAVPEGSGTLLDNTLIVWGNELSAGNVHSLEDIPFVVAGNLNAQFRTGRVLNFGGQPHNRLLYSVLGAMGVDSSNFGHPEFLQAGPLTGMS